MRCLKPIEVCRKNFEVAKYKNPNATRFMLVPCGKCINCLKDYIDMWGYRLQIHANGKLCYFVTLTYDDEHLPKNGVDKPTIQKYIKRLRIDEPLLTYFLISEYGPHGHRPHYHAIFFNIVNFENFEKHWKNGFVTVDQLVPERINYVVEYHILKNQFISDGQNKNFRLISKGIGLENFEKLELENCINNDWQYMIDDDGHFRQIHRYFRDKFQVDKDIDIKFKKFDPTKISDMRAYDAVVKEKTNQFIYRKMLKKSM